MRKPQLKTLDPQTITLDPNPIRQVPLDADYLRESVRRFGVKEPVHVEQTGKDTFVVYAGNTRVSVAQELGLKGIPALVYKGLKEEERNALRNDFNRRSLSTYEQAILVRRLVESGLTEVEIVDELHETISTGSAPERIRRKAKTLATLKPGALRTEYEAELRAERHKWLKGRLQALKEATASRCATAHLYAKEFGEFPAEYNGEKLATADGVPLIMTLGDVRDLGKGKKKFEQILQDVEERNSDKPKAKGKGKSKDKDADKTKAWPVFKSRHFLTLQRYIAGKDVTLDRVLALDAELVELDKANAAAAAAAAAKTTGATTTKPKAKAKAKATGATTTKPKAKTTKTKAKAKPKTKAKAKAKK